MLRVLIAEDEPLVAFALREQLERRDCIVTGVATTGNQAVDFCHKEHPEVVLMDVCMPELDGIEASRRIMEQNPTCVVMLTAYADLQFVLRAEEAGVMAYLLKPVSAEQVLPTLELARRRFSEFLLLRKEIAELQNTLETRKLVERAKGILMDRTRLSETEAFRKLQKLAMNRRLTLRAVAEKIISTAEASDELFSR